MGNSEKALKKCEDGIMTDRKSINILKGFLISLAVVAHFGQTIANNLPAEYAFIGQGVMLFIATFVMAEFFFVSGFLSKNVTKRRDRAVPDLLLPYVIFQIVYVLGELIITRSPSVLLTVVKPQLGAWFLMTLFVYRMILPEIRNVRGILIVSVVISAFTCVFKDLGSILPMRRILGYFVFFMAGYFFSGVSNKKAFKINKWISRAVVLLFLLLCFVASRKMDYDALLQILARMETVDFYSAWYFGPLVALGVTVLAFVVGLFVVNAMPSKCKMLEKIGEDTMPLYLSHLIVFSAIAAVLPKDNWIIVVAVSILGIVFCIWVFSTIWYRKIFHGVLALCSKAVFREEKK